MGEGFETGRKKKRLKNLLPGEKNGVGKRRGKL